MQARTSKPALSSYFCLVTQMSLQLQGDTLTGNSVSPAAAEGISLGSESVSRGQAEIRICAGIKPLSELSTSHERVCTKGSSLSLWCTNWDLRRRPHLIDQVFTEFIHSIVAIFLNLLYNRKADKILIRTAGIGAAAINYTCAQFQRQEEIQLYLHFLLVPGCFLIKRMVKQHAHHL